MIKRYCDICDELLGPEEGNEVTLKLERLEVRILRALDGCWNGYDVCHNCVITAVNKGSPPVPKHLNQMVE